MKYLNFTKHVFAIAILALLFTACKKVKVPDPMGDAGQTLVKIVGGGAAADVAATVRKNPIDFVATPTVILACDVRRDIPNETELNKTMTVTVKDNNALVPVANPLYVILPAAWYTIGSTTPKTGGSGGTFTLVMTPGQFAKPIFITITNPTLLDPSTKYALGFTITTADASGKISANSSQVLEIGAKNAYDGIYSVVSGWVQRYTAGVPEPITAGGLNGDLTGNPDIILSTIGAYTVSIPPSSAGAGRLGWAFGSNNFVAGIDGVEVTVDPVTNLTTALSQGYGANSNATFANWAGHVNKWVPSTKTFTLAWRWNPTGNTREYEIVLKYKGSR